MSESGGDSDTGETHFQHTGGASPVSLRQAAPSRGRDENVGRFECIYLSFLWKEVPAGRRLGAQSGVKKESLKSTIYESTLSTADAVPLPQWGRQISNGYAAILADGIPVRKALTKLCVKILVEADSAIESAFP